MIEDDEPDPLADLGWYRGLPLPPRPARPHAGFVQRGSYDFCWGSAHNEPVVGEFGGPSVCVGGHRDFMRDMWCRTPSGGIEIGLPDWFAVKIWKETCVSGA